ncbi:MAG: YbaK/EbsC family protein [Proteobacteria bacterium]|nr:YbaK/EbsC family protein [Pseudomonadota bacterium]
MALVDSKPVQKVISALREAGLDDTVTELDMPLESPVQATEMLDTVPGAIITAKVFAIGKRMVLTLVAGDHAPVPENLPAAFFLEGEVREATDAEVRGITGYSADSVPPVGLGHPIPVVMDRSLKRFDTLYAIAGDPQCVFKISYDELKRLTGAIVSWNIAEPLDGEVGRPAMTRSKTFTGERDVPGVDLSAPDAPGPGGD